MVNKPNPLLMEESTIEHPLPKMAIQLLSTNPPERMYESPPGSEVVCSSVSSYCQEVLNNVGLQDAFLSFEDVGSNSAFWS